MNKPKNHAIVEACNAIGNLIDEAHLEGALAAVRGLPQCEREADRVARQLDAVRTTLIQEGHDHLVDAWVWIDASHITLSLVALHVERPDVLGGSRVRA